MNKHEYFKKVQEANLASTLSNKVLININATYAELNNEVSLILNNVDDGFYSNLKEMEGKISSSFKHANKMILLELLINQMNVLFLFEAVKNNPNNKELQMQLELIKKQFLECHAKESTYFA